jgi:hypothetical protein
MNYDDWKTESPEDERIRLERMRNPRRRRLGSRYHPDAVERYADEKPERDYYEGDSPDW